MNQIQSRRDFLAGLAGLGASIIFPSSKSLGQSSAPAAGRIDVHHHFGSPAWISMVNTKQTQGYQTWQPYTPARAIEDMDRGGVSIAMISITTPGIWLGNIDEARRLARRENEYGARMVSDYKRPFRPVPWLAEVRRNRDGVFRRANCTSDRYVRSLASTALTAPPKNGQKYDHGSSNCRGEEALV